MAVFRDTQNGRNSSSSAAQPNGLFINLSSCEIWTLGSDASKRQSHYQQAIYALLARARCARDEIESLYSALAAVASQAHALRDIEAVELASQIMLALRVSPHSKYIARYYAACCMKWKGEFEAARERLDQLLEEGLDPRLRCRALLTKAATYFDANEVDQSLPFYLEAGRIARDRDLVGVIESLRQIAVIKSIYGDHHQALADLESLLPIVPRISRHEPHAACSALNSYAVELGEIGQVEQALNVVSTIAPFASIHPEVRETIAELQRKRPTRKHSVVVIHHPTKPVAAPQAEPNPVRKRATLSTFVIREAERRFTSYRAPPAFVVRPTSIIAVINPARHPTKPRAP